jgi:hypothetical protein
VIRAPLKTCLRELGVAFFFLALAAVQLRPLLRDPLGSTLVGPDPLIDLWTVQWVSGHLLEPGQLYEGNIFAPSAHAAVYSDLSLGTAVLVAPFRVVPMDPVPLYNLSLLLALAFGGWGFCALSRELTGRASAGLIAGTLASFSSHQMSHIYHLNLLSTGWLALFLLGLHRLLKKPGWSTALLLGVSFTLSAQSTGYYAVAAAILALLFALVHARSLAHRGALLTAAGGALLALLLMAPYLRAFGEVRREEHLRRPLGMSENMAFHPGTDLSSVSYVDRAVLGAAGERLFPGFLTLALAAAALVLRPPRLAFGIGSVLLLFLLSLGPRLAVGSHALPLPYTWLFRIPLLEEMRHPYTFASVGVFLLAVLASQGFAASGLARNPWMGAAVVAASVLETLAPPPATAPLPRGLPPIYGLAFSKPPGILLEIPPLEPETLLWAARHGRAVANGAGAFLPRSTQLLERYLENHWLARHPNAVDDTPPSDYLVHETEVRYLILPVGRKPALGGLVSAFDSSRTFALLGTAADGDRLYEIRRDQPTVESEGKSLEK